MGRADLLDDDRYLNMESLRENQDNVDGIIEEWTSQFDNYELFHRLQDVKVTAGPVMHPALAFEDPHLKQRDFFTSVTAPEVGTHLYPTTVFKMSKIPFSVRKPPVRLGEDNDYVYREVLGLSDEEYRDLDAKGHIGMDYLPHVK